MTVWEKVVLYVGITSGQTDSYLNKHAGALGTIANTSSLFEEGEVELVHAESSSASDLNSRH